MYHNKEKLATHLYTILDDLILEDNKGVGVSIDKLINPAQKYSLVLTLIQRLPKTLPEYVKELRELTQRPIEAEYDVESFIYSKDEYLKLFESVISLGFSLGYKDISLYHRFVNSFDKVKRTEPEVEISNVLKDLTYIRLQTQNMLELTKLTGVQEDALEEIIESEISKVLEYNEDNLKVIKTTIKELHAFDIKPITKKLNNGYMVIENSETHEILNPVTFEKPNIKFIINTKLNN